MYEFQMKKLKKSQVKKAYDPDKVAQILMDTYSHKELAEIIATDRVQALTLLSLKGYSASDVEKSKTEKNQAKKSSYFITDNHGRSSFEEYFKNNFDCPRGVEIVGFEEDIWRGDGLFIIFRYTDSSAYEQNDITDKGLEICERIDDAVRRVPDISSAGYSGDVGDTPEMFKYHIYDDREFENDY